MAFEAFSIALLQSVYIIFINSAKIEILSVQKLLLLELGPQKKISYLSSQTE
jgi:hypothetical protein